MGRNGNGHCGRLQCSLKPGIAIPMSETHLRYGGSGIMAYWLVETRAACVYSQIKSVYQTESQRR